MSKQTKGTRGAKKINMFSAKRIGIQKAGSRIFAAVVVASIVVSFSAVTINFLWDLRGFNNRVIAERTKSRDTLRSNLENLGKLELSFLALEEDSINSQVVLDALPSKFDFPAIATSIDGLVASEDLDLERFSGEDLSSSAPDKQINPIIQPIPLSLEITGSYEEIENMLKVLERTIRPFNIKYISLSGTDDVLTTSMNIDTFYQPGVNVDIETKTVN